MAKKKTNKTSYVSKGERPNSNQKLLNATRGDRGEVGSVAKMDRIINQYNAHAKGKYTKRYGYVDKDGKKKGADTKEQRFFSLESAYNKVLT